MKRNWQFLPIHCLLSAGPPCPCNRSITFSAVRSLSRTFPLRTHVSMDSSIRTDMRTGISTKVRRIRQRPMQTKSPCLLSTCKRYASTEDISRMTTARQTFLPKFKASSYASTAHWREEPIRSILKRGVHPFYSAALLIL